MSEKGKSEVERNATRVLCARPSRLLILTGSSLAAAASIAAHMLPCADYSSACMIVSEYGLCAAEPFGPLLLRICGNSCGTCAAQKLPRTPIHTIDRVSPTISYANFYAKYKSRNLPVVFEGWQAHAAQSNPRMASFNLTTMAEVCGDRKMEFAQRRHAFVKSFLQRIGPSGSWRRWLFDEYSFLFYGVPRGKWEQMEKDLSKGRTSVDEYSTQSARASPAARVLRVALFLVRVSGS